MTGIEAIRGLLLPLPTVFDTEGEVDEPVIRELVSYYVSQGVNGLFILGSYGQGPALEIPQRFRVAELVLDEVAGRIPVVVHIGAVDPYTSIKLGRHAREAGATAVGVVGPYYYSDRSVDELVLHFRMVDEAVQMPILLYNNPPYQGYPLTLAITQRLVQAVPRIFGAKLAKGGIDEALPFIQALPGFGPFILVSSLMPGMLMGVRGAISPPMVVTPALGVALVRAIDEQRYEDAIQLQVLAAEINQTMIQLGKKYGRGFQGEGLRALGFDVKKFPRWPTPPVPEEGKAALKAVLERAGADAVARLPINGGAARERELSLV